jgi:three-Cys-motif partner protein
MHDPEEVDYHSLLKHKFIEIYLDFFLVNVVDSAREAKRDPIPLQIYDLYAGRGRCHSEECERLGIVNGIWPGSALIAAKCIGEYPSSTRLFLNSYNPSYKKCVDQRAALDESLNPFFEKYPLLKSKTSIISKPVQEAITVAQPSLIKNYPNVWILDPYEPLPWSVINSIANLTGSYQRKGKKVVRRPELIINLMSSVLQRFSETHPDITSTTLGMPEKEWMPAFQKYKKEYGNAREAILRLYFDRLKTLYGRDPVFTLVRDVTQKAIVYAMLLCSTNDAGYYLMGTKGLPILDQFKIEVWEKTAKQIVIRRKVSGQQFLETQ